MTTLFNTLTKSEEKITTTDGHINVYSCGPTVYDYAHIGNFRSFLGADFLVRTLKLSGNSVDWVMNITDVDDKTIKKTVEKYGTTANVDDLHLLTTEYFDAFLEDLESLNIDKKSIRFIRVSEVIPHIQDFIVELLEKGFAYTADDGSTYFSIEKYQEVFGTYGELVGQKFLEGKKVGARIQSDEYDKDNLSDFALWKKHSHDEAEIYWDHDRLGKGRPGWHIECSVINNIAFGGKRTDIHTGGIDLIFPHHTNEIAQSTPIQKEFVRHWFHTEHMLVDGKKMAKSLGNFFTLRDLNDKDFSPLSLRYLTLTGHYKSQTNFTFEALEAARNGLLHLIENYSHLDGDDSAPSGEYKEKFLLSLQNNLDTPAALRIIYEVLGDATLIDAKKKATLNFFDEFLGLSLNTLSAKLYIPHEELPLEIQDILNERNTARSEKNWQKSDELREKLQNKGYTIEDTEKGTRLRAKIL